MLNQGPCHHSEESLEKNVSLQLSEEYANLQHRHRLCSHERLIIIMCQSKSADYWENSLLSDKYLSHQTELDSINVNTVTDKDLHIHVDVTELEVVRCNAQLTYYQATGSDRSVLYFKHYNEIANSASLE